MIVLMITYLPDRTHIVSKNDADGAYKIYYTMSNEDDELKEAVDREDVFQVYHRKDENTNFVYIGKTSNSLYIEVDGKKMINLFLTPDQAKKRTLFSKANNYVQAVADEYSYSGDVVGSFFACNKTI